MKKLKHYLALVGLLAFGFLFTPLHAQVSEGGTPPSFALGIVAKQAKSPVTPPITFDVAQMKVEDAKREAMGYPPRAVRVIPVELTPENSGEWTTLPDGQRMWRLSISVPGAIATMLTYDAFVIPEGGKLFIYNQSHTTVLGAYTSKTNAKRAEFATELVGGSELTLEYIEPPVATAKKGTSDSFSTLQTGLAENGYKGKPEQLKLIISGVGYGYNYLRVTEGDQLQVVWPSLTCQVNVNCPEGADWQHEKRGIARILTYDAPNYSMCSGTVINNTSSNLDPLFLSAFHCYQNKTAALMNQSIYYFNYEAPGCTSAHMYDPDPEGPAGINHTIVGATLLTDIELSGGSDGALLRLNELIPESYNVFYNGWDRRNVPATSGVGISHPRGDIKKIATYTTPATTVTPTISGILGGTNAYWQVFYTPTASGYGLTEGGSSGSPLFNQDKRVVGTLTGGPTETCATATGRSIYGKLWSHWDQGAEKMKDHLDPSNTGVEFIDGIYATGDVSANFAASKTEIYASESVTFTDLSYNATSWTWTFNGGTPGSHTGQTPPAILYNTLGDHVAKLVVNQGTADEREKELTIKVKLKQNMCPASREIGTGTDVSQFPLGASQRQSFSSAIYTAAELNAVEGGTIKSLAWNAGAATTRTRTVFIYLKEVDDATLTANTWANELVGATLVYQSTGTWVNTSGWVDLTLTTPFSYSGGTKNLKVLVRTGTTAASGYETSNCSYTATTDAHMTWTSTVTTVPTTNGTVDSNRPNIKFGMDVPCGAVTPVADFAITVPLLKEGFDNATLPAGWVIEKPGASANQWRIANPSAGNFNTIDPASKTSLLVSYDSNLEVNTWLKSPTVAITAPTTKIEFYILYGGNWLSGGATTFYVSKDNGTTWEPNWTTGNVNNSLPVAWRMQSIDLSGYVGENVMFAWQYIGRDGDLTCLDGIYVYYSGQSITINEGETVSFTDLSVGPPVLWSWTLPGGDPATSALPNIKSTYMAEGIYDATLGVTSSLGSNSKTVTNAVTVNAQPMVIGFASYSNGMIMSNNRGQFLPLSGGLVSFEDKTTNYPRTWDWTFPGGTPAASTDQNVEVSYPAGENSYLVTFDVTNPVGPATLTIPDYVKVGGTANVWNVQYGEETNQYYMNGTSLLITPGSGFFAAIAERFTPPAPGIITSVKVFTTVTSGNPTMTVGIYADNGGVPGALLSTIVAVPNLTNSAYNTATFPQPVAVSGAYHVVLSKATTPVGVYAVPTVAMRASGNTVSVFYDGMFRPISSVLTGHNLSMNVSPEFTYSTLDISGPTSFLLKNIDATVSTVSFTTNASWTASADSWINLSATSGTGSGSFNFTVNDNPDPAPRNGLITVKAGGYTKYIVVRQIGTNPVDLVATFMDDSQEAVALTWKVPGTVLTQSDIFDDAEGHTDFTINSAGSARWSYIDGDGAATDYAGGVNYTNRGAPMAFMVMNSSQTTPAWSTLPPHGGNKFFASFCSMSPPNNDWMISPALAFPSDFTFSFWGRSFIDTYGLERFEVVYSTGGKSQSDFTNVVTPSPYVSVPTTWTRYSYTIPANAKYVAIHCVSNNAFIFTVDDIFIGTGIAPTSAIANELNVNAGAEQPEWIANSFALKHSQNVQKNIITKKSPYKLEAASAIGSTAVQNGLGGSEGDVLMAAGATVKLRWDNGLNNNAIGLASGADIEVAVRFEAPDLLRFHGLKMLAVDIFPRKLGNSMVLNIRQNGVVVHSQPLSGLTAGTFNRVTLATPMVIDASKELMIGYAFTQLPGEYVPGCDAGPAVRGKGDLISINGGPLEALSSISALNVNWNIAGVIENKLGANVKLEYNVYRDGQKLATVSPTNYDDLTNIQRGSCYEVTALYNDDLESTPSNDDCVTARHTLKVTVADVTRTVGQPNPTFVLTYTGFEDGDTQAVLNTKPTATTTATAASPVGTYPITISGGLDDKYQFEYVHGTLTVERKEVVVTAVNTTRYVGQVNPTFALTYTGFIGGDTEAVIDTKPVATSVADHTSPAGTYPIVPAGGVDDKYTFTYVPGTLTVVNQIELIVGVTNVSRHVGEANPTFQLQYSGFTNGDTPASLAQQPTVTCFANASSLAGTYPITVSGGSDAKYRFTYVPGTLTIAKRILTVTVQSVTCRVGDPQPIYTVTYSGFVDGDTHASLNSLPISICQAANTLVPGQYDITASGGSSDKYEFVYVHGILTILAAAPMPTALVATVANNVDVQLSWAPTGTASDVSYKVYRDGVAIATVGSNSYTNAGVASGDHCYQVSTVLNADQSESTLSNQACVLVKYVLTVGVQDVTRYVGDDNPTFVLTYSGFVNGDNAAVISDKPVASASANKLSPAAVYDITVSGGSSTKYRFVYTKGTLTVKNASEDPTKPHANAFTPYEIDGINDIFLPGAKIVVVNRYSQLIYEGNNGWNGTKKGSGQLVAPGTYYYTATMLDGSVRKGSVTIVKK